VSIGHAVTAACLLLVLAACATRSQKPAPVAEAKVSRPAPSRSAAAKPPPAKPPPAATAVRRSGDFYTVKPGDTLYSIALEHGADYREVAQWNGLDDPTLILVGQQLRVSPPPGHSIPGAAAQIGRVQPPVRVEARPLESPLPPPAKSASAVQQSKQEPVAAQFVWPARGKILAEFGEPRRKGIDIDGNPGDPVVAAAAGRVTYTGTGIPGMGKLVVIKHNNGYITVYAHNRDIVVKEQQQVARGEKIAELGSTDSDRPKLHFQIRKGADAVDPLRYLPGS
jgi:lipoprotein NlpD